MNPKTIVINLVRDINKFVAFNLAVVLLTMSCILFFEQYDKKEIILAVSVTGISLLVFNFFIAQTIKKRMTKMIKRAFERLETQLYFDELTAVYNRNTGINRLKEEILRANRTGNSLCIAMLDIDNFKSINDTYGHLIGDRVLNHVSTQIKNSLRGSDIVSRYGGEEFLIILPDTDEIRALMALERVRESIENKKIRVGNEKLDVTVSIGVTEVGHDEDALEAIARADMALYQAKKTGKNKVEIISKDHSFMNILPKARGCSA